jgi:hypothetical protein
MSDLLVTGNVGCTDCTNHALLPQRNGVTRSRVSTVTFLDLYNLDSPDCVDNSLVLPFFFLPLLNRPLGQSTAGALLRYRDG